MHTGTKIKLLREHHRFSQEFVASELKISQASLSRIESGRVNAKFNYFYILYICMSIEQGFLFWPKSIVTRPVNKT